MEEFFNQILGENPEEFYKAIREMYSGLPTITRIPKKLELPLVRLIFFQKLLEQISKIQEKIDEPYSVQIDESLNTPQILQSTIEELYRIAISEEGKGREEFIRMLNSMRNPDNQNEEKGLLKRIFKRT